MTTATANGERQRTSTDGLPQATRATALVSRAATWLRDEEAAGSNPATPTQVRGRFPPHEGPAFFMPVRHWCAKSTETCAVRHHAIPDPAARLLHDSITLL